LAAIEKGEIEATFASMAKDEAYQAGALRIVLGFDRASWEALKRDILSPQ
jgi:hypothetical protein